MVVAIPGSVVCVRGHSDDGHDITFFGLGVHLSHSDWTKLLYITVLKMHQFYNFFSHSSFRMTSMFLIFPGLNMVMNAFGRPPGSYLFHICQRITRHLVPFPSHFFHLSHVSLFRLGLLSCSFY